MAVPYVKIVDELGLGEMAPNRQYCAYKTALAAITFRIHWANTPYEVD